MKLIDILARDLPGLGGWPKDKTVASHGPNNCVMFHELGVTPFVYAGLKFEGNDIVTKEEYEAAIAASKPEWDGEGLPPVGIEAEVSVDGGRTWCLYKATSERNGMRLVEIGNFTEEFQSNNWTFRTIRSEADKKKEEAIKAIFDTLAQYDNLKGCHTYEGKADYMFSAIAAGKIPHIRID
ncbi:hypothetical protein [Enterobacter roggenkampii]|uniref:hypothetical protein n=1 Tax=Enterobacter roggenkampii TaxID=1812935 RepID=UPI000FCB5BBC|nr:hypothetical protein [Enterobacter roggenkampii]